MTAMQDVQSPSPAETLPIDPSTDSPALPTEIPDPTLVRITTKDRINVRLATEEIRDRALLLPGLMKELDRTEADAKISAKEWKNQIQAVDNRLRDMRRVVETGEEFREVECQRVFDIKKGITWLEYSGHKYLQRSITTDELGMLRQGTLFDEPPAEEGEAESEQDSF